MRLAVLTTDTPHHRYFLRRLEKELRAQIDQSMGAVSKGLGRRCDLAPSAIDGHNRVPGTDPFHIRRIMVGFEGRPYPYAIV